MASPTFELAETEHVLAQSKLKLLARSTLRLTLPQASFNYHTSTELVTTGLWITRGNGLKLSVRIDLGATDGLGLGRETILNGISDTLCEAKLWSQLSLKASRIDYKPNESQHDHQIEMHLAINYSDSSCNSLIKAEKGLNPLANVHDVKPPSGIQIGFIDSIDIVCTLIPSFSPDLLIQRPILKRNGAMQERRSKRYCLRALAVKDCIVPDTDEDDSAAEEDLPLPHPSLGTQAWNDEKLQSDEDSPDDLLFPQPEHSDSINPGLPRSRFVVNKSTQPLPSSSPQPPPSPALALLKLLDASLRHVIAGTPPPPRRTKKSTTPGIKFLSRSSFPALGDISPSLFRPGYIQVTHLPSSSPAAPVHRPSNSKQAISSRAPLIPRIASSLFAITSRSPSHHQSSALRTDIHTPTSTPTTLQPPLWRLLQNRKWPTSPLEPLECTDEVFVRSKRDLLILMEQDDDGLNTLQNVMVENDNDEDMLDNTCLYASLDRDEEEKMLESDGDGDEDLFSLGEGRGFASQ
ncbi:MAG: hypothetical protein Q9170_008263, partial [Blastenia crenularia]